MTSNSSKRLVVLGLVLQALHVLFGITAVMGMLINHMLIDQSKNTVFHSQLRWQLITFWLCAILYVVAFLYFYRTGLLWPLVIVLAFTFYRITTGVYYCIKEKPLNRIL